MLTSNYFLKLFYKGTYPDSSQNLCNQCDVACTICTGPNINNC